MTDKPDYGEPWFITNHGMLCDRDDRNCLIDGDDRRNLRIAKCVNAMNGIDDPEAWMIRFGWGGRWEMKVPTDVQRLVEAANEAADFLDECVNLAENEALDNGEEVKEEPREILTGLHNALKPFENAEKSDD